MFNAISSRLVLGLFSLAVGLLGFGISPVRAQVPATEPLQQQIYDVIDRTAPAIVEVHRRDFVFSGVVISPRGHVLTAGHTIVPGQRYTVNFPDGRRMVAIARGACEQTQGEQVDCGLLRIIDALDLPYVPLGDSASLVKGQPCLSISYPGGQRKKAEPLVRLGTVGRTKRTGRMLQTTALMEPGDSGGPLLDLSGRVIGVHSQISLLMSQNFDVPVDQFKSYWNALNVPAEFVAFRGQAMPRLGFVGRSMRDGGGIRIMSVQQGGIADQMGLVGNDILTRIHESELAGLDDLQPSLHAALQSQVAEIRISVLRGQERKEISLSAERFRFPKAEDFPQSSEIDHQQSKWLELAKDLDSVRQSLETTYKGVCINIASQINGSSQQAMATPIEGSHFLVSKSSLVGDAIVAFANGHDDIELTVAARDGQRDLVLLRSPHVNAVGVRLAELEAQTPSAHPQNTSARATSNFSVTSRGQLVFTPTPDDLSWISVVGSSEFESERLDSRGYLGVMLRDYATGGVILTQVEEGAARRAGLRVGDVITRIGNTPITQRSDIQKLLLETDPATTVQAQVQREADQLTLDITLGSQPVRYEHSADLMAKSARRDGFPKVFSHDATLAPHQCGGPLLDLEGNFLGINIARYSRVRTFVLPASDVAEFVRQNTQNSGTKQ